MTIEKTRPLITQNKRGSKSKKLIFKRALPLFLLMLPALIYLIINNYLPMLGLIIAFKDIDYRKGVLGSEWVGFENFKYLFKTKDALIITRNTVLYNLVFIVLGTIAAIVVALLLNEIVKRTLSKFYQSVILLPALISYVIVSYFVVALLSVDVGLVNNTLQNVFGISKISWYTEPKYWPYILVIVRLWKTIGFSSVIYYAAIIGINKEFLESAALDGASKLQQIWYILLPQISPIIITLTLLDIGRIFYSDFGLFYQVPLDSGALYSATNVIDTYVYRGLLVLGDVGMSSAAGAYQSIVGFILILISNFVVRKIDKDRALF